MSLYVVGIRPPDEKWTKMKAVWETCTAAKVEIPNEVIEYFNNEDPDPRGVIIELLGSPAINKFRGGDEEGLIVDLKQLPGDLQFIKFVMSY